jgi:two-component system cell cycle sensor histidine kinase/response regulator CckA
MVNQPSKVLVVDDYEMNLTMVTKYLEENNFHVSAANNGLDALDIFEAENGDIDLLITDLKMPGVSGVGIISIVKERYPKVPIIAMTGWGEYLLELAAEARVDYLLEKPFDLFKLNSIIQNLLSYG